jgi:hypothetical protein
LPHLSWCVNFWGGGGGVRFGARTVGSKDGR